MIKNATMGHTPEQVALSTPPFPGRPHLWYWLNETASQFVTVDANNSLTNIWFTVNNTVYNQDSAEGFPIQDQLIVVANGTCLSGEADGLHVRSQVAVRHLASLMCLTS